MAIKKCKHSNVDRTHCAAARKMCCGIMKKEMYGHESQRNEFYETDKTFLLFSLQKQNFTSLTRVT